MRFLERLLEFMIFQSIWKGMEMIANASLKFISDNLLLWFYILGALSLAVYIVVSYIRNPSKRFTFAITEKIFSKLHDTADEFEEINIKELSRWGTDWGKQYDRLNRIVLYAYLFQSELRYDLYFEFDVFSKEGEKQSEEFNQGTWDHDHFLVHNKIEEFKSVYNEKPKDSDYIYEWDFFCNAREANKEISDSVPSIEIYKKKNHP